MFPNQQPPQSPPPNNPNGTPPPQPPANPYAQPLQSQQTPQQLPGYGPQPAQTYAVDYLDQIAPPPPKANFLSGTFGKAIIGLGILFVLAVSIIVAFGNQKRTADLENIAVRLDNLQLLTKNIQKDLKSNKLLATNSNLQIWVANANRDAYALLTQAEVKKTQMDKKMIAAEKVKNTELTEKLEDARLNANLDRVYARELAYQTNLLLTSYTTMSKKSEAKAIRDYAKKAIQNLTPIQKALNDFDDSV